MFSVPSAKQAQFVLKEYFSWNTLKTNGWLIILFFLIKRLGEKFEYCSSYINDQWKPPFAIFQNKQQVASVSWVRLEITTIFK